MSLTDHKKWAEAKSANDVKVGDRVLLWHYQILREGEVLKVTKTRVRVRFKLVSGYYAEAFRKKNRLRKVP